MSKTFTCLYIPTDETQDISERTISYTPETEIGCLTSDLREHFAKITGTISAAEVQNTMFTSLEADAASKGIDITDENKTKILAQLANSQMVDIVPLQLATSKNNFTCVSLYVDDKGVTKGVPMNMRATQLSVACGRPVRVMGDAFVARARDDNMDLYERGNFIKSEFSPGAKWIQEANESSPNPSGGGSGGSGGGGGVSTKTTKKANPARLEKYAEQLEQWVLDKLKKWEEDDSFREERKIKYETKENFETYLRTKVEKKMLKLK